MPSLILDAPGVPADAPLHEDGPAPVWHVTARVYTQEDGYELFLHPQLEAVDDEDAPSRDGTVRVGVNEESFYSLQCGDELTLPSDRSRWAAMGYEPRPW